MSATWSGRFWTVSQDGLPGMARRRRPPLPQTDLGSIQMGFPGHPDPEPEHTSASGTVARTHDQSLHNGVRVGIF